MRLLYQDDKYYLRTITLLLIEHGRQIYSGFHCHYFHCDIVLPSNLNVCSFWTWKDFWKVLLSSFSLQINSIIFWFPTLVLWFWLQFLEQWHLLPFLSPKDFTFDCYSPQYCSYSSEFLIMRELFGLTLIRLIKTTWP